MKIVFIIKIIAVLTFFSGLGQMIFPSFVLGIVGANADVTSAHFFGIVGMFMALFGGLLWQTLSNPNSQDTPIFWSALQKLGAATAVPLGVIKGVFSFIALGVAGFDFFSAILLFIYWNHLRKNKNQ
jgi:hypothetical protein